MQKIWLVAKPKVNRLPPALLFLYEPLAAIEGRVHQYEEICVY